MTTNNAWQTFCTDELKKHVQLGRKGSAAWGVRRWELFEQAQREQGPEGRVIIADLVYTDENLRGYSFFSCYLIRCDFSRSNLSGSDFELSIIRDSNFNGSKLERTTFEGADISGNNQFLRVKTNGKINFSLGCRKLPEMLDGPLKREARSAWAKQDDELHEGSRAVRALRRASGYGLSINNVFYISSAIMFIYAIIWSYSPIIHNKPIFDKMLASVLFSMRYFLGITEVYADSNSIWSAIGLTETSLGIVMLAMLISAITRRLTIPE